MIFTIVGDFNATTSQKTMPSSIERRCLRLNISLKTHVKINASTLNTRMFNTLLRMAALPRTKCMQLVQNYCVKKSNYFVIIKA